MANVAQHVRMGPSRDVGASGFRGNGVLADEPGDVVIRHPCRTMTSHGVEHRGLRFRSGVENGDIAVEVPGCLAGDGQASGFGAFPEQVRGESPGVDVGEVQGEHFAVAGSEVIHEDHEELTQIFQRGSRPLYLDPETVFKRTNCTRGDVVEVWGSAPGQE
jgi:hypothetical protein